MSNPESAQRETHKASDVARFREALKVLYPPSHPVHDPSRVFTWDQLEQLENAAFAARGWA